MSLQTIAQRIASILEHVLVIAAEAPHLLGPIIAVIGALAGTAATQATDQPATK